MTKLMNLTNELTELADNDYLYVYDASNPSNPDAKMPARLLRPAGVKITNHLRYEGNITAPALAAGVEGDATIAVTGALVGDHAVFNLTTALPASLAILHAWVSALGVVTVRFRNMHASAAYAGGALTCVALVSRSVAP